MRVRPLDGYIVDAARASQVVSPAYDALTPAQRHEFATTHPQNYLNVMRSREEFPANECPELDELLATNAATLKRMMDAGDFVRYPKPAFFVYRLREGGHVQTGLVAEIPVEEYEKGLVKKHEHTQTGKEDDLTIYQTRVRASSSPICLTYPAVPVIEDYITLLSNQQPLIEFVDRDGLEQTIWAIDDESQVSHLKNLFARIPESYLTDGHHRAASATRFRDLERVANTQHTGEEPYNLLLVAFFPSNQLRILEYNRCVKGLNGRSPDAVLRAIETSFALEGYDWPDAEAVRPRTRGEFSMFVDDSWYRLTAHEDLIPVGDPVGALDVSILQTLLLGPILSIDDPRTDARMSYLSGAFGMSQLEEHCRENDLVGFAVYPTAIEDLMAVADIDDVMPPKSTWFDPKLRSGIFLRMR